MSDDNQTSRYHRETAVSHLGSFAYVVVDGANCLYQPNSDAAVRVIPPYGTLVPIVRDEGEWVLIRFCDKDAWSLRQHLSADLVPRRDAEDVGVVPAANYDFRPSNVIDYSPDLFVEVGPRGGRFVRTASGFRRYL